MVYGNPHDLTCIKNSTYGLSLWKGIMRLNNNILQCSNWTLGRGNKIRFWEDIWCGEENFQSKFPLIYKICSNKNCLLGNMFSNGNPGGWNINVTRNLNDWEVEEYENLLNTVNNLRPSSHKDKLCWKLKKNAQFSVKSYHHLNQSNNNVSRDFPSKII